MRTLLALIFTPALAFAQAPAAIWSGSYDCAQGETALTLTVRPAGKDGQVTALFRFGGTPANPSVPDGCFLMYGTWRGNHLSLQAGAWLLQPGGYVTVDLDGTASPDKRRLSGQVDGPGCTTFRLVQVPRDDGPARCSQLLS